VRSELESAEEIEPELSVRSQSSIYRSTKRVHGSKVEFTAFAQRSYFAFEIPTGVAPSFETSSSRLPDIIANAVRHHWSLRLEFITSPSGTSEEEGETPSEPPQPDELLELVEENEKGTSFTAVETLYCESFDCHVPIEVLPTNQEIPEDRVGLSGFAV
jgi:RAB6A-GEF complex partner protein 2